MAGRSGRYTPPWADTTSRVLEERLALWPDLRLGRIHAGGAQLLVEGVHLVLQLVAAPQAALHLRAQLSDERPEALEEVAGAEAAARADVLRSVSPGGQIKRTASTTRRHGPSTSGHQEASLLLLALLTPPSVGLWIPFYGSHPQTGPSTLGPPESGPSLRAVWTVPILLRLHATHGCFGRKQSVHSWRGV